jgi:hypothetical protein
MHNDGSPSGMVTYLLGAGASVDAGLPTASQLTGEVLAQLNGESRSVRDGRAQLLNFVVSALVLHRGRSGSRPDELPDIESVVSAIELLDERASVELAPFVQSWDPSVDALDRTSKVRSSRWARDLHKSLRNDSSLAAERVIVQSLETFLKQRTSSGSTERAYQRLRDDLVRLLVPLLQISDERTDYLRPLVELGRDGLVNVATLNYDLTVETAARRAGVSCSTGIDRWNADAVISWPDDGVRLLKLHGSVDWARRQTRPGPEGLSLSHETIGHWEEPGSQHLPFVVYGRREKLRPEGPFLDLRAEFVKALGASGHLVSVGYSFSDHHVNELIRRWLVTDTRRVLVVVDPDFSDQPLGWWAREPTFSDELRRGLWRTDKQDHTRVIDGRLVVVRERASVALPRVCGGAAALDDLLRSKWPSTAGEKERPP